MLTNLLTPEFFKGLAFEPRVGTSWVGYGENYWRRDTLSVCVRAASDQSGNIAHLFGHDPKPEPGSHPLWTISFTQETPVELVTAMLRRASDYVDVVFP
jgi:hypothetical protein